MQRSFFALKLISQFYLDIEHDLYSSVAARNYEKLFIKVILENLGCVVRMDQDLGIFLNKPNADQDIKNWFLESFDLFETLISSIKVYDQKHI